MLRAAEGLQKQAGPFGGTVERPSVARAAAESRGAGQPGRYILHLLNPAPIRFATYF